MSNFTGPSARAPPPITSNARAFQPGNRPSPNNASGNPRGVQQLKPQALPGRASASNILVSSRQRGNPILKEIKSQGWEFADTPADYVIGATSCALYLSLKYHKLHPDYIYNRIRELGGKYNLRILLVLVDVTSHEEIMKELSKTSLINNVTLILCWSVAEAGRYLELYKTYEHAPPTMIKAPVSMAHGDRLVDFITTPRSVNKTDAMSLVGNFGSVRTAVNARPEELLLIAGWGQTKVKQWHGAVTEPFRTRKAARRGVYSDVTPSVSKEVSRAEGEDSTMSGGLVPTMNSGSGLEVPDADMRPPKRRAEDDEPNADEEEAMREVVHSVTLPPARVRAPPGTTVAAPAPVKAADEPAVSDGVLAALARLRKNG